MDSCCTPRPRRGTLGEAIIAGIALLGFVVPFGLGHDVTIHDVWAYAGFLAIIVAFYFLLLLCRAIFTFMVGDDSHNFWWEKYAEQQGKKK